MNKCVMYVYILYIYVSLRQTMETCLSVKLTSNKDQNKKSHDKYDKFPYQIHLQIITVVENNWTFFQKSIYVYK